MITIMQVTAKRSRLVIDGEMVYDNVRVPFNYRTSIGVKGKVRLRLFFSLSDSMISGDFASLLMELVELSMIRRGQRGEVGRHLFSLFLFLVDSGDLHSVRLTTCRLLVDSTAHQHRGQAGKVRQRLWLFDWLTRVVRFASLVIGGVCRSLVEIVDCSALCGGGTVLSCGARRERIGDMGGRAKRRLHDISTPIHPWAQQGPGAKYRCTPG